MKRIVQLILAAVGLCSGCSQSHVMTPGEFTGVFADAITKAEPDITVVIVCDLELKITSASGGEVTCFLDNAYDTYQQAPETKDDVIQTFVASNLETISTTRDAVDRTRIIPIIKDRPWLEETRQALINAGMEKVPEHVFEEFNADLTIVYAEDSPKTIRYLEPKDLESADIDRSELRALACQNLERLLPNIERHGANGLYMITAGGDYEASLLVLDSVWSSGDMEVKGDVVVAIPTRDLLLVTGSEDPPGIEKVRRMAKEAWADGTYRLTEKLFVYRNGTFEEFPGNIEPEVEPNPASLNR